MVHLIMVTTVTTMKTTEFVDYFQHDPNLPLHTIDYHTDTDNYDPDNMNGHNDDDLDSEHDMDLSNSFFRMFICLLLF